MVLAPLFVGLQSLPLLPTIQLGPSCADSGVGGWACARSRSLWVSLRNCPVRLGVSPTAASTPTGVFNQRFEALFPQAGALGCLVCFAPPLFLPVYLCGNVGSASSCTAYPVHSTIRHLARVAWSPLCPGCSLRPSYRSGWMFLLYVLGCWTSMQFDFMSVLVGFCF